MPAGPQNSVDPPAQIVLFPVMLHAGTGSTVTVAECVHSGAPPGGLTVRMCRVSVVVPTGTATVRVQRRVWPEVTTTFTAEVVTVQAGGVAASESPLRYWSSAVLAVPLSSLR